MDRPEEFPFDPYDPSFMESTQRVRAGLVELLEAEGLEVVTCMFGAVVDAGSMLAFISCMDSLNKLDENEQGPLARISLAQGLLSCGRELSIPQNYNDN